MNLEEQITVTIQVIQLIMNYNYSEKTKYVMKSLHCNVLF